MVKITNEVNFEKIYNDTYAGTLKYVVLRCNNMDDINDIIQDTYIELLKIIKKRKLMPEDNTGAYIIGIANNIIKRHYYKKKKENLVSFYSNDENTIEPIADFDLEQDFITKENVGLMWEYVKGKDLITAKIFYLYFALDMKIGEIAKGLNLGESNVKNRIYRTLKEIKKYLGKDVDGNG